MDDDSAKATDAIACPICQRPLRRTSERLLTALECEQCGPFSDFNSSERQNGRGPDRGPDGSGSGPLG